MYDLDAIRVAHPIVETVCDAGVDLRRTGQRLAGRCPFHEDRAPSLVVYAETGSYFCFGCHVGGDVIDFVGRLHRTTFKETVAQLSASAGARPRLPANVTRFPSRSTTPGVSPDELAIIEAAVEHYANALIRYADVRAYLLERGVDLTTAQRLRLGYAAGGLARRLTERRMSLDVAQRLGLLAGDREPFAGRVIVPDLDAGGRARWLTGRALGESGPRYLNLRVPSPLLGLSTARLRGEQAVIVVEGPFDWLTARCWGLPAVALLGTHASRDALLALRGFRGVYVALDADGPGRRAAVALAADLGLRATIVALPHGIHDRNELGRRREGRALFVRSLREYRLRMEESWSSLTIPDPRARAA